MDYIILSPIIEKYKVQSGKLNNSTNYYFEFSETLSGGHTNKNILTNHVDNISLFSDYSDRIQLKLTQRNIDNNDRFVFLI